MAKILFKPVCSKCNHIIEQTVALEEIELESMQNEYYFIRMPRYVIHPFLCPNCKEAFEEIMMPSDLPFCGYDLVDEE